jgi:FkbM family methyltransferase
MTPPSILRRIGVTLRDLQAARTARAAPPYDGNDVSEERATLADVHACYRLLLRRNPDPTGMGAYTDQVTKGIRVKDLIAYFIGSPEWIERGLYRAAGSTGLVRVETADFPLYVIASDPVVARELIATREYEPHLSGRLAAHLQPGMTFVDVGANVGFYSILAARRVGAAGRVVAFEPNADNLKPLLLNRLTNACTQIDVRPFAVSDQTGFLSLMKIVSIASTKELDPAELEYLNDAQVVYAVTLDDVLAGERRVDLVKCDVDGHDFCVMKGARGVLERFRPHVVAEFNPGTLRACSRIDPAEYLHLFSALGYAATVLSRGSDPVACGADPGRVLEVLSRTGHDQVDLWLTPRA